jgi:hypothetical protein
MKKVLIIFAVSISISALGCLADVLNIIEHPAYFFLMGYLGATFTTVTAHKLFNDGDENGN